MLTIVTGTQTTGTAASRAAAIRQSFIACVVGRPLLAQTVGRDSNKHNREYDDENAKYSLVVERSLVASLLADALRLRGHVRRILYDLRKVVRVLLHWLLHNLTRCLDRLAI